MKALGKRDKLLRIGRFVIGMIILIVLNLIGNQISSWIPFPIPGPVLGLLMIFILLSVGWIRLEWVDDASSFLLLFLGLFYVPYGVGIIDVDASVQQMGWKMLMIALIVVLVVMLITGKLFTYLGEKMKSEDE